MRDSPAAAPASAMCGRCCCCLLCCLLLLLSILQLLLLLGVKERELFSLTLVAATPALVSRTEVGESGAEGRSPRTGDLPLLLLMMMLLLLLLLMMMMMLLLLRMLLLLLLLLLLILLILLLLLLLLPLLLLLLPTILQSTSDHCKGSWVLYLRVCGKCAVCRRISD